MNKKIFVSYKHQDNLVRQNSNPYAGVLTARHYVDYLMEQFAGGHIYKGEGNEDLSQFKDETIRTHLKDRIFDSTITIVLISKGMIDHSKPIDDQWIPWEISYSLKEKNRGGRISKPNAILAVVLPDENGSYEYACVHSNCEHCKSRTWQTNTFFPVIRENMFNKKQKTVTVCNAFGGCQQVEIHQGDDHSYIHPVFWDDFTKNMNHYIEHVSNLRENADKYHIRKILTSEPVSYNIGYNL